jgi:LysR family glycine cleavage system transcriptional activator
MSKLLRHATPSLPALQAFEMAAKYLSYQRAAKDLGLTPSAVSHRIRGLEQKFGVRLFERAGRAIRLSDAGQNYLETVRSSLDALELGSLEIQSRGANGPGLRISSLPFFTNIVIIPALEDFRKRFPNTSLQVAATHEYANFDRGGVDAAIRYGRERSSGLRFDPLLEVHGVAVCSPRIARRLKSPLDLAKQPLIHISAGSGGWPAWLRAAGIERSESENDLWFDNVLCALEAARCGQGVALAMHPLITAHPEFGRSLVVPFDLLPVRGDRFYLVYRAEHANTRRIAALRRWLSQAVECATKSKGPRLPQPV